MSKKSLQFLGINFGLTWALALLFFVFDIKAQGFLGTGLLMLYMLMPAFSVYIVQKWMYKEGFSDYGIVFKPNIWFLVAWTGPVLFALSSFGVSLLFPGIEFSAGMDYMFDIYAQVLSVDDLEKMEEQLAKFPPSFFFWISIFSGLVAGVSINALFAFGEELGWRGLLQHEWKNMGFWKSNLLIGAVWGLWHAPIILRGHNYPDHPELGVGMMIIWCTLLAPIFGFIRIKTGSVVAASVMHGSLNALATLGIMFLSGGSDLLVGVTGLAGFLMLLVINIAIALSGRK